MHVEELLLGAPPETITPTNSGPREVSRMHGPPLSALIRWEPGFPNWNFSPSTAVTEFGPNRRSFRLLADTMGCGQNEAGRDKNTAAQPIRGTDPDSKRVAVLHIRLASQNTHLLPVYENVLILQAVTASQEHHHHCK
jgi:hypothetical protein